MSTGTSICGEVGPGHDRSLAVAGDRTLSWAGRRVVLLVLYGLIALCTWAILWRRSQLAALPDVGDPFVGAALRSPAPVPDDRNAFVAYRRAVERFRDMNVAEGNSFSNAVFAWSRADATFRAWVAEHDEAISLLCAGAALPEFFIEVPVDATVEPATLDNGALAGRIVFIGTAGLFKAGRLRAEGDPAGAWSLLNAIIRASRHIEWAVPTANGRSHGIVLAQYARLPVAAWANDPTVGVALLRRALDDLAAAESLTPPLSIYYRQEYQASLRLLTNVEPLITARAQQRHDRGPWHLFALAPGLEAFLNGEPERSRRVLNLLVANDLAWCDRPASDRPAFADERLRIPEPDAAAPAAARALAPEELARWADSALITPGLNWRLGELDKWERNDRWSFSQLTEAVAVSLFTKETGHAPASPAEALRRYRPSPGDMPDRDEAEPICDGSSSRFYADRIARCHRDYRGIDRALVAGRSGRARGCQANAVREQLEANRPGHPQLQPVQQLLLARRLSRFGTRGHPGNQHRLQPECPNARLPRPTAALQRRELWRGRLLEQRRFRTDQLHRQPDKAGDIPLSVGHAAIVWIHL